MNKHIIYQPTHTAGKEFEAFPYPNLEHSTRWRFGKSEHDCKLKLEDREKLFFQQALQGMIKIAQVAVLLAKRLAPVVARTLSNDVTLGRKKIALEPAGQLPESLLNKGEIKAEQKETEFFGTNEAKVEVGQTEVAREAALTEVLAAEASHCKSESEAQALIGTALSVTVGTMHGKQILRPVMPILVQLTARLVHLLHQHGAAGPQLLRLVPLILRRTVASACVARTANYALTPMLTEHLMARCVARVMENPQMVKRTLIRNTMIRQRTVAFAKPVCQSPDKSTKDISLMAQQNETLFEAPASHQEFELEDLWENHEAYDGHPEAHQQMEAEWENHESSHYNYANPELEQEQEWEEEAYNYGHPEAHQEMEEEGESFSFGDIGKFFREKVAPIAKKIAPSVASTLTRFIPGVGAIAAPIVGGALQQVLKEAEMEAENMEAEFFGTNEGEAEVGHGETAYEAALTEMLAAEAAESESEAEAVAHVSAALPITATMMGGRNALRRVMPTMTQANADLACLLHRKEPQLLRLLPTIHRRTIAGLHGAYRSGKPISGELATRTMAAVSHRVLSDPDLVEKSLMRNSSLREQIAPSRHHHRRRANQYNPGMAGAGTNGAEMLRQPQASSRHHHRRANPYNPGIAGAGTNGGEMSSYW